MKLSNLTFALSVFILGSFAAFLPAQNASAEVLIAPTRLVMENGERSAELVVVNKGTEEAAFRLSVENRRMLQSGAMEKAETAQPDEKFAKEFIRFTPKRVILKPGERQTVRVSVKTAGLEPGEYRSHLRLMSAPTSAGRTLKSAASAGGDDLKIQLIAIRSLTIPIIARVGTLDADVAFGNAKIVDTAAEENTILVVNLKRSGTSSTYGQIQVFVEGQPEPVFLAKGVAIYTPNRDRDVKLAIPAELSAQLRNKTVRIAYVSADPKNPETYADLRTVLN